MCECERENMHQDLQRVTQQHELSSLVLQVKENELVLVCLDAPPPLAHLLRLLLDCSAHKRRHLLHKALGLVQGVLYMHFKYVS